jgi:transporter family-2 protein
MSSSSVAALVAVIAGIAGAAQIAVQARLGDRIGSLEALACASVIGGIVALGILVVGTRSLDGLARGAGAPPWMLLGGVMSAMIILAITVSGPRIGIVATTAVLIATQFTVGALIDRFGWFGVERVPLTVPKLVGLALLAAGAALTLRR